MTVRLRELRDGDDGALAALFADPECARWNPGPADGDVARWRAASAEPADDFRTWAVVGDPGAGDDVLVGTASVFGIGGEHDLGDGHAGAAEPATGVPTAEIGVRVAAAVRGRGVARAAVELAVAWAAEHGVRRLVAWHAVANEASCRTFTRCGFTLDAVVPANHVYGDRMRHDEHRHVRVG